MQALLAPLSARTNLRSPSSPRVKVTVSVARLIRATNHPTRSQPYQA